MKSTRYRNGSRRRGWRLEHEISKNNIHSILDRLERRRKITITEAVIHNPFLPKEYIKSLKETFDPQMFQRMYCGKWFDESTNE